MIGAIIGDIAGSTYEFYSIKTMDFPLFAPGSSYTDDSLMSVAVASALMQTGESHDGFKSHAVTSMRQIATKYPCPMGGYGGRFRHWLVSSDPQPYGSFGNGSAMRVSPCGDVAATLDEALALAKQSAEVTHSHPKGIKGAQAVAAAIYLARTGESRDGIRGYIEQNLHYEQLSYEMSKCLIKDKRGRWKLNKRGEILALQRSRIVAGATEKLTALREQILPYARKNNLLVYCGATNVLDERADRSSTDEGDVRQIEAVTNILGNELGMSVSKFTADEDMETRALIIDQFQKKGRLQAIVAIKCLDEGVNIPGIRTAFILASTTNPKEYIQRRGRVLRKAPGKEFAEIYDFVTLPRPLDSVSAMTEDQAKRDMALVRNELARIKEFGRLSMNPMDAESLIWEIQDAYHITSDEPDEEEF